MDQEDRESIEYLDSLGYSPEDIGDMLDYHPYFIKSTMTTIHKKQRAQELIDEGYNQAEAARIMGIPSSRVSTLLSGYDYSDRVKELQKGKRERRLDYIEAWRSSDKGKATQLEATKRQRETRRGREATREVQRRYYEKKKGEKVEEDE